MKRTFRKIMSLLLAVTLVFGTVAFGFADVDWSEIDWHDFAIKAEAAETFTEGYYTYTVDENGNATITDFTSDTAYSVTIPSKLDGHPVTVIGGEAFSGSSVHSVTIPEGVTDIGNYAFYLCSALTSAEIPDSVTSIGYRAFYNCASLSSVTIGNGVKEIDHEAFGSCDSLKIIYYSGTPEQWNNISGNGKLNKNYIFECNSEKPYYLPGTCGENLTWILYTDGELLISGTGAMTSWSDTLSVPWYSKRSNIKKITINNGIMRIGDNAFYGCSITSVTIPDSVISIGDYAFSNCNSLENITIPDSITSVGDYAFDRCFKLTYAYYSGTHNKWKNVNVGCNNERLTSKIVDINSERPSYPPGTCGENLTWIHYLDGELVISGTGEMTVWSDSSYAPWRCSNFKTVTIGSGVTSISLFAFEECFYLTNIAVDPANEAYSSDEYGVLFNKDKTELIRYPLANKRTSYVIPDSVTNIENSAFSNCDFLEKVVIRNNLTSVGSFAFYDCSNLTRIEIPESVISVGDYAFYFCFGLSDVYYQGTPAEWKAIAVGIENDGLKNAKIHYGYVPEAETMTKPSTTKPVEVSTTTKPIVTELSTKPVEVPATTKPVEVPTTTKPVVTKPATEPTKPVETEPSTTKPVEIPVTTKPVTTKPAEEPSTTKLDVENTTKPVTTEPSTVPATQPSAEQKKLFEIRKPSQTEITYGDSIILHADFESKIPEGAKIIWATDNANFKIVETTSSGETCIVTPNANGNTVFTATLVDADGNAIASDTQTMTAKAGFFQKIIAFFKKIFGLTKVIPEMLK